MAASELAARYAGGLFQLAQENNSISAKKEQAESLLAVLEENPDLLLFLEAVKITDDEKKKTLRTIFHDSLDEDMLHFLLLVVDKNRVWSLKEMLQEFVRMADESLGIARAVVISARPLPEEEMQRIQKALETKTRKQIVLTSRIDPSVIAGIKVVMGNTVTDVTMKSRIDNMRDALLKGGQA